MGKLICIGSRCDIKKKKFSGQSIMFDGVINSLTAVNTDVAIIDISSRFKKKKTLLRAIDYLIVLVKLLCTLCKSKYDLAYTITSQSKNGFLRDNAMITICRWFGVPVVAHQYGANYNQLLDSLNGVGKEKLKKMLSYVSAIIVEGEYMKEQFSFLSDYQTKVKVIPNGLPVEGKHAQIAKRYDKNRPFVMFYLSNLIWSKGYFDVLEAVDILVNSEHLNVRCVFAGRFMSSHDDERSKIANKDNFDKFIKDHSLSDRIEYFTGLYGDDKDKYFYESNVFLLPSYYINEGQPVSIIEAMAYGCVPIVTNFRHIPMMVNEGNGFFVDKKSPSQIAAKVKYLIENPDSYNRMSQNCISDYLTSFTFDKFSSKVTNCLFNNIKR